MKKGVVKLVVYAAVTILFVLVALIANNLLDRENILKRISTLPDLQVKTIEGVAVSTGELPDELPVLLTYFNTECPSCQHEFTEILEDEQLQGMALLVFVSDETPEIVRIFREGMGIGQRPGFVFLYDENRTLRNHFGIRSVPANYLYSREGKLIQFYRGLVSTEKLRTHLLTYKSSNGD